METEQLCLGAELTIFTVASVKTQLLSALEGADAVALDLSAVSDVDTAGLQLLLAFQQEARQRGKHVAICAVAPELADAAAIFHLASRLGLTGESERAMA